MDSRQAKWLIEALEDHADATVWAAAYASEDATAPSSVRSAYADEALEAWHERLAKKHADREACEAENDKVRMENARGGL